MDPNRQVDWIRPGRSIKSDQEEGRFQSEPSGQEEGLLELGPDGRVQRREGRLPLVGLRQAVLERLEGKAEEDVCVCVCVRERERGLGERRGGGVERWSQVNPGGEEREDGGMAGTPPSTDLQEQPDGGEGSPA